jgi:hypothetical protein
MNSTSVLDTSLFIPGIHWHNLHFMQAFFESYKGFDNCQERGESTLRDVSTKRQQNISISVA